MRSLALLIGCIAASPGCIGAVSEDAAVAALPGDDGATTKTTHTWNGHVLDSTIDILTHIRPSEDVLAPWAQSGFLFEVQEVPKVMQVYLTWKGDGKFLIMLHSHKEHGTNTFVEHKTELDETNPKCLQVPTEDLMQGEWQVMTHTEGAHDVDFALDVVMLGGAGQILDGQFHGHWTQDGRFETEEKEYETCETLLTSPEPPG